ncbi:hypothetical protein BABA_19746 [Neobacillus bataviensis LMG 21833]|uniref:DUF4349 domain-containing protein n=1 Tax=Neobacillus bataviensis LMG 21833 TaxID=1117379 RepID=K6C357_9BACI|nr:DUF4349 domain-containing protein [Neobacillus bataviensis]EKN65555.1 hypothetical protein BABA_19746 [Neobacillus bataviensis LMG 21833]
MKKLVKVFPVFVIAIIIGITGCSSSSKSEDRAKMSMDNKTEMDSSQSGSGEQPALVATDNKAKANQSTSTVNLEVPNQMVIYQADLQLRVKKFEQTVRSLEEKAEKYGGYIAESNVSREGNEQVSGSLKIRIPQKYFQDFLHDAEGQAAEVLQRNITGQDVTEEYVDLESRLKSKRVVEERLLAFMKDAVKTEDLLKISTDLAAVQEEIEMIEGRMKFLENQTSLSTVTITLYENKVIIPNIDKDKLNTWEKTKQQFMKSTNLLLAGLSGLVVFIIGNIPVLAIFIIIGIFLFVFYKKRKNRNSQG